MNMKGNEIVPSPDQLARGKKIQNDLERNTKLQAQALLVYAEKSGTMCSKTHVPREKIFYWKKLPPIERDCKSMDGEAAEAKELPLEFKGRGEVKLYSFKQVKRSNLCYIYEVLAENGQRWYEVFKTKVNPLYGNISYPSSKQFGLTAWTCKSLQRAEEIFKELIQ